MDKRGVFNFSTSCSVTPTCCKIAKTVIAEVNRNCPRCLGGNDEGIPISDVDYVVEGPNTPLVELPPTSTSEVDHRIAEHVMRMIEDGSTIQLGIGSLPYTVGAMIAKSDLKDIGVHTEMLADSYVDMYEAGRITGRRKNIDKGKMVYTFALGSRKLYDFLDNNPMCAIYPVEYTNDLGVICSNDKMTAINNALEVDLFSQVASESSGCRQISGTGGQLDFVLGAFKSNGGKDCPPGFQGRSCPPSREHEHLAPQQQAAGMTFAESKSPTGGNVKGRAATRTTGQQLLKSLAM